MGSCGLLATCGHCLLAFTFETDVQHDVQGQASDIKIHAEEIMKTRSRLNQLYVEHTNQNLEKISEHPRHGHILCCDGPQIDMCNCFTDRIYSVSCQCAART